MCVLGLVKDIPSHGKKTIITKKLVIGKISELQLESTKAQKRTMSVSKKEKKVKTFARTKNKTHYTIKHFSLLEGPLLSKDLVEW